jgi:hypothetical protein
MKHNHGTDTIPHPQVSPTLKRRAQAIENIKTPGSEGGGERGWGQEQGGEMTQTMYAHVNK